MRRMMMVVSGCRTDSETGAQVLTSRQNRMADGHVASGARRIIRKASKEPILLCEASALSASPRCRVLKQPTPGARESSIFINASGRGSPPGENSMFINVSSLAHRELNLYQ